ncbi:MAG: hypothetical protein JSR98_01065 [Proteobacteria bacterium]|nr:hypothetical protein [Pseudomonadota bacterium]
MTGCGWAALIGAAALAAEPAVAGQSAAPTAAPAPTVSGLTVTGQKPDPLVDRTTEFVRQRLPTNRNEQYARFRDPICVKVIGLPDGFDAFIGKRVFEMAKRVGAPVAPAGGCTPNVNVIFSTDPQAQLKDIAKRRDILFGHYFQAEAKQVATFSRPIQSWYLTRTVGTNGDSMLELKDTPRCISSEAPGTSPCDIQAPPMLGKAGSRLGNDMSSELVHSLVIADAAKVAGLKIEAVADYIAVLALSRWQGLERCTGLPTILNLMADGCDAEDRPDAATSSDLALLTGLYKTDPREAGTLQRSAIASYVRKAAKDAETAHERP